MRPGNQREFPLVEQARARADEEALRAPECTYRYGDLLASSARVAATLLAGRTDLEEARVAVLVPPGFTWVTTVLGIWRAGGMAVPLSVAAPEIELAGALEDAEPEAIVADPGLTGRIAAAAATLGIAVHPTGELVPPTAVSDQRVDGLLPRVPPERGALMLYTSGTTGRPKGVVHTHASLSAQVGALVEAWRWSAEDHALLVLPLHHVHGIVNVVLCAMSAGARCSILPRFDAVEVWERLATDRLTVFMAVPTIYKKLIDEYERADEASRGRWRQGAKGLRLFVSGSAALPVGVLARWEEITSHRLLERYGMTEIGMALSNPLLGTRVPGHVGTPLPGMEVRVIGGDGTEVADGAAGELQVRGPSLFRKYWRRPDETAAAFVAGGWFRTGDEVAETPSGFRILGRRSVDILKTGGEKVSALEIEEVLRGHPDVSDCAVVGVPDPTWGDRICAAVVGTPGRAPDPESLRTWVGERLSPWKVPREVLLVETLPANALGKVVKPDVRHLFEGG